MGAPEVVIDWLGGQCPVQAEGTVSGKPFCFRARGASWSMSIGGDDLIVAPEWRHKEAFGVWPDAGWMTEDEARARILATAARYHRGEPGE